MAFIARGTGSARQAGAAVHPVRAGADCFGAIRSLGISQTAFKHVPARSNGLLVIENIVHAPGRPARHGSAGLSAAGKARVTENSRYYLGVFTPIQTKIMLQYDLPGVRLGFYPIESGLIA